jgi:RND family efflux transporter MFP subunit
MKNDYFKYLSTLIVVAMAILAGWWLWNYYMQSPWTRDGKVRAELINVTPEVSGALIAVNVKDNQRVKKGEPLFSLDAKPYQIALDNALAAQDKARFDLDKANHEAARRRNLPAQSISAEALDEANIQAQAMQSAYKVAQTDVEQARWNLSKTTIYAPADGYITNLHARVGNYAAQGSPLVALVDADSFYVMGYFEETKLRHIKPGMKAEIVLYNGNQKINGEVDSIGRAIYDQSLDTSESDTLLINVKPNVPWVRLAQRVPVRIKLVDVPADTVLIAGTTSSIAIVE